MYHWRKWQDPDPHPDPLVRGIDSQIRIRVQVRTKISWIRNTGTCYKNQLPKQTVPLIKVKQWEEDDFYASDEDEFLDRTGSIEKKRHIRMRMAGKEQEVVQTFESLSQKHAETEAELVRCVQELGEAVARRERAAARSETSDLDSYVAELKRGAQVDKETVQKLKMKIIHLKQEKEVAYLF
jgi:hypothetical protein